MGCERRTGAVPLTYFSRIPMVADVKCLGAGGPCQKEHWPAAALGAPEMDPRPSLQDAGRSLAAVRAVPVLISVNQYAVDAQLRAKLAGEAPAIAQVLQSALLCWRFAA